MFLVKLTIVSACISCFANANVDTQRDWALDDKISFVPSKENYYPQTNIEEVPFSTYEYPVLYFDTKADMDGDTNWDNQCIEGYQDIVSDFNCANSGNVNIPITGSRTGFWTECGFKCKLTYSVPLGYTHLYVEIYQKNRWMEVCLDDEVDCRFFVSEGWQTYFFGISNVRKVNIHLYHSNPDTFVVMDKVIVSVGEPVTTTQDLTTGTDSTTHVTTTTSTSTTTTTASPSTTTSTTTRTTELSTTTSTTTRPTTMSTTVPEPGILKVIDVQDDMVEADGWVSSCGKGYQNDWRDYSSDCKGGIEIPEEHQVSEKGYWTPCIISTCQIRYVIPSDNWATHFGVLAYQNDTSIDICIDKKCTNFKERWWQNFTVDFSYQNPVYIEVTLRHVNRNRFNLLDKIFLIRNV